MGLTLFIVIALVLTSLYLLKARNVMPVLKTISVILILGLMVSLAMTFNDASRGGFLPGLGVIMGIYILIIPFFLLFNFILYSMVITKTVNGLKFAFKIYFALSVVTYSISLWAIWAENILPPILINEYIMLIIGALAIVLIYIGLPTAIVVMLVVGLKATKGCRERRKLVVALAIPIAGSLYAILNQNKVKGDEK